MRTASLRRLGILLAGLMLTACAMAEEAAPVKPAGEIPQEATDQPCADQGKAANAMARCEKPVP